MHSFAKETGLVDVVSLNDGKNYQGLVDAFKGTASGAKMTHTTINGLKLPKLLPKTTMILMIDKFVADNATNASVMAIPGIKDDLKSKKELDVRKILDQIVPAFCNHGHLFSGLNLESSLNELELQLSADQIEELVQDAAEVEAIEVE